MFRIRYSILPFLREISLKVFSNVITDWFVFFKVTIRYFKDEKN